MDIVFWLGIAIGGMLSVPLSIAANLWTDRVRDYLDKRRTIRLSKKKSKEVHTYLFVRALLEGNPAVKVALDLDMSLATRASIYALASYGMLGVGLIMIAVVPKLREYPIPAAAFLFSFWLFGSLLHVLGGYIHYEHQQVRRKMRRFLDYENSIREKWGDDAIEEFFHSQPQS